MSNEFDSAYDKFRVTVKWAREWVVIIVVIDGEDAVTVIAPDPECEPALNFDLDRVGDPIRWRYLHSVRSCW